MGQKITLVDDINGEDEAVGELTFIVDGLEYSVDLNEEHMQHYEGLIQEHRAMLLELAEYGRPVVRQAPKSTARTGQGRSREELAEIREWARSEGYKVSDFGRIREEIIDAFETRSRMPQSQDEKVNA